MKQGLFSILYIISLLPLIVSAQQSGPQFYRSAVMDGNAVKTVFGNWGVLAQPTDARPRAAWKYLSNGYIGDESILIGLEFPIKDYNADGKMDTVHSVVSTPVARPAKNLDTSPTGDPWTFMPVETSVNVSSQSIAISNDNTSWPSSWAGKWRGMFNDGEIVADLESYYEMNDDNDHRYDNAANNPHSKNFTGRMGQGISVAVRYLQFKDPQFEDILFRVYDIRNNSAIKYQKMIMGYLNGTYIGITGNTDFREYDDDYSVMHSKENIVIAGDYPGNNDRNPFWIGSVGKYGISYIDAPAMQRIASYRFITPSNNIDLRNDEELWSYLTPGKYQHAPYGEGEPAMGSDADFMIGSDYFSLDSGTTKRIATVLTFGNTVGEIALKTKKAQVLYRNNFNLKKIGSTVQLNTLNFFQTLSGTFPLKWSSTHSGDSVEIHFSPDGGHNWQLAAEGVVNDGSYEWDTKNVPDCSFGKIVLVMKNGQGEYYDFVESVFFAVNNEGNGAPFLQFLKEIEEDELVMDNNLSIPMLISDPEKSPLTIRSYFNVGGGFVKFNEQLVQCDTAVRQIELPMHKTPNSNEFILQCEVSDGEKTFSTTTLRFRKQNERKSIHSGNITIVSKSAEAPFSITIVEPEKTTNDTYRITFDDISSHVEKRISVYNVTKQNYEYDNTPFKPFAESPVFGGISFVAEDFTTEVDTIYWRSNTSTQYTTSVTPTNVESINLYSYPHSSDYRVIYYDHIVDTSKNYYGSVPIPITFQVENLTFGSKPEVVVDTVAGNNFLYLFEKIGSALRYTWNISINPTDGGQGIGMPKAGDTLFVNMKNGFSIYDTIEVKNSILNVSLNTTTAPQSYSLSQNYPNPFNPTTSIQYSLPSASRVTVKVYNILGQQVAILVNSVRSAGQHETTWNAQVASGLYFYRLDAVCMSDPNRRFTQIKKMVLIK